MLISNREIGVVSHDRVDSNFWVELRVIRRVIIEFTLVNWKVSSSMILLNDISFYPWKQRILPGLSKFVTHLCLSVNLSFAQHLLRNLRELLSCTQLQSLLIGIARLGTLGTCTLTWWVLQLNLLGLLRSLVKLSILEIERSLVSQDVIDRVSWRSLRLASLLK